MVSTAVQPGIGLMSASVIGLVVEKSTCHLTKLAVASSSGTRKTISRVAALGGLVRAVRGDVGRRDTRADDDQHARRRWPWRYAHGIELI